MKQWIWMVVCGMTVGVVHTSAMAQERIYRCGNEYTNSATVAKQRNCQLMEGGQVTVVHTGRSASSAAPAPRAGTAETKPASSNRAAQVDPGQQKARDNDARAILQAELTKAQERLNAAKAEYNDGNPTKTALELRNPQVFNERLESLKANIARQEADVAGIQRELSRHKGG